MNPSSTALIRAGAACAFLAAAFAGWQLAGDPAAAPREQSAPGPAAPQGKAPRSARGSHGPPEHVRAAMAAIRNAGPAGTRMQATLSLVQGLSPAELREWLEHQWFDAGEGFELTLFRKVAMQRLWDEDPEGTLAWCKTALPQEYSEMLQRWAHEDPERVLRFLQENPDRERELQMLQMIAATRPELAFARAKEMLETSKPGNGSDRHYFSQVFNRLAAKDPAVLEAALEGMPAAWRFVAEGALAGERLKADFDSEIRALWERPDGWKIFNHAAGNLGERSELGNKVLAMLEGLPAEWRIRIASESYRFLDEKNAANWMDADLEGAGFGKDQIRNIRYQAMHYLAQRDPEDALRRLADLEMDESQRRNLISNLFSYSMHTKEEEQREKLLGMLGDEKDLQVAREALQAQTMSRAEPKAVSPADWLEKAAEAADGNQRYGFLNQIQRWDKAKQDELAANFRTLPEEKKTAVAKLLASGSDYYSNSSSLTPGLQGEAIRYLLTLPAEEPSAEGGSPFSSRGSDPARMATTHALQLAKKDADAAAQWVNSLPAGEGKQWAQKNLAANWMNYDPDSAGMWLQSLPAAERKEVEAYLKEK